MIDPERLAHTSLLRQVAGERSIAQSAGASSEKEPVVLSWSGGKDSAMALYELHHGNRYHVVSLLTMVAAEYDRVSHHGVRVELLRAQAAAVGLPLETISIQTQSPSTCGPEDDDTVMREYERLMGDAMLRYTTAGVRTMAFGDIFLEGLRAYRERKLAIVGMSAVFPIWGRDTSELARTFVDLGFKAYLSCVDAAKLGESFAGRAFDQALLRDLPAAVDPCGEHGEYHSFVFDGPFFLEPVKVAVGEVVLRDVRYFADLLPVTSLNTDRPALAITPPARDTPYQPARTVQSA